MESVPLKSFKEKFGLKEWTPDIDIENLDLINAEVNRPALQLAGFFDYFDSDRLQLMGLVECAYLKSLDRSIRDDRLKKMFELKIPCLVLCRGLKPFDEMLNYAEIYKVPILGCDSPTTAFMSEAIRWLKVELAPSVNIHGVLVDVYGEGLLIMGESGIGKSEAALELIKRGHRLVADDAVIIKKVSDQTLVGACPEIIQYFIELRGIGIIDVRQMFGVEAVKETQSIDLVIKLENWDERKEYERLGLSEEYTEILGISVISHSIPVRPGRNLAVICESAAVNHRQKKMGYNAAKLLDKRMSENIYDNI